MEYTHKKLKNGLNVFLVNMPDAQSVLFTITAKVGSRYEPRKLNGVSHFLEHIFFKGSKQYPSPTAISEIVDAIGGDFNAATSKEATEYYIKAEKHHFELVFKVLTDMLLNPLFDNVEIQKEKGVVIEEINMYKDSPASLAESRMEEVMWPDSALGRDIVGTKESVAALTREDLLKYREEYYKVSNMILGISGNFNEKKALKLIESTWGKLASGKVAQCEIPDDLQKKPRVEIYNKQTEQAHLALGFKSYGHGDKNNPAALLLSIILGGNMSSRLFFNIREHKGLAYYISAGHTPYKGTGSFSIHAGVRIDQVQNAVSEILKELRRIRTEKVSEVELKRAKDFLKGKIALSFESRHKRIGWVTDHFAATGKVKTVDQFLKEAEKVKEADILKAAKDVFQNKNMTLSVVGPLEGKNMFEETL